MKQALKFILLILVLILTVGKLFVTVLPYDWATDVLIDNFGLAEDFFDYSDPYEHEGIELFTYLYHNTYRIVVLISAIVSFAAVIILYKGRTLLETLMLFNFLAIPRQRKNWGKVIDATNKKPVPLAILRLFKFNPATNSYEYKNQMVSDFEGRYKFQVEDLKEKHKIEVKASGYNIFERNMDTQEISLVKGLIIEDIALAMINADRNLRNKFYDIRPKLYIYFLWILFVLSFINFLRSFYGMFIFPQDASYIEFAVYAVAFVWNISVMLERFRKDESKESGKEIVEIVNPFN